MGKGAAEIPVYRGSGLSVAWSVALVTVLTSLPVFLPGAANGLIGADLGWSPADIGAVLSAYWLASAIGAFLSRRTNMPLAAERTLGAALLITGSGLLLASLAPASGLWISAGVGGLAYGYTQPHTNVLLVHGCPPHARAAAFGLKQAAVPAATLTASVAMPLLAAPSAGGRSSSAWLRCAAPTASCSFGPALPALADSPFPSAPHPSA